MNPTSVHSLDYSRSQRVPLDRGTWSGVAALCCLSARFQTGECKRPVHGREHKCRLEGEAASQEIGPGIGREIGQLLLDSVAGTEASQRLIPVRLVALRFSSSLFIAGGVMLRRSRQWLLCLFCVLVSFGPAGCSDSAPPDLDKETRTRLRKVHQAYALVYSMRNRFPRGGEEVRSVLNDLHDADLADEPDKVLRSPRDEQPFGLVLGVRPNDANSAIMIYEKQGADGSRYVLTCGGEIRVLSDAEFAGATFAAGHSPDDDQPADSFADSSDRRSSSR